jgi:hypothetical protein
MLKLERKKLKTTLVELLTLTFGSVIFAAGVACFLDPNSIA